MSQKSELIKLYCLIPVQILFSSGRINIITGPNFSGKSIYIKQVSQLLVLYILGWPPSRDEVVFLTSLWCFDNGYLKGVYLKVVFVCFGYRFWFFLFSFNKIFFSLFMYFPLTNFICICSSKENLIYMYFLFNLIMYYYFI